MSGEVKYPHVVVQLSGESGNAYFIIGTVLKALARAGVSKEAQEEFSAEAQSGDFDHLLQTVMATVTVE